MTIVGFTLVMPPTFQFGGPCTHYGVPRLFLEQIPLSGRGVAIVMAFSYSLILGMGSLEQFARS